MLTDLTDTQSTHQEQITTVQNAAAEALAIAQGLIGAGGTNKNNLIGPAHAFERAADVRFFVLGYDGDGKGHAVRSRSRSGSAYCLTDVDGDGFSGTRRQGLARAVITGSA